MIARNVNVYRTRSAEKVLAAICVGAIQHIFVHRSKVAKAMPEELHQVRIGLRKIDTAIRLLYRIIPKENFELISKELKWLRGELSSARNLDVFGSDILKPFANKWDFGEVLSVIHRRELDRAYARATKALRSAKFRRLMDRIGKLIKLLEGRTSSAARSPLPAADVAAKALKTMRKKMRIGRAARDLSDRDLHRLRLRTKRMRYAIEFTSRLFGKQSEKGAEKMARALRDLQAYLGEITDRESHVKIFYHLMKKAEQQPMSGLGARAGRARLPHSLIDYQARKREGLKKVTAAYGAFEAAKPFWPGHH